MKKENKNFFTKMIDDKKYIIESLRKGKTAETIERERDVKFVTPI